MSYDIDADSKEMEEYLENLKHVKSKLYEFIDLLQDQIVENDWNDENRMRFNATLNEIIRNIRIIVEDFDPPIRELQKMMGVVDEMGRCFMR